MACKEMIDSVPDFAPLFLLFQPRDFQFGGLLHALLRQKREPLRHYIIEKGVIAPLTCKSKSNGSTQWKLELISISEKGFFTFYILLINKKVFL